MLACACGKGKAVTITLGAAVLFQMTQDKFILSVGAQVGGCLVDGLGDGVMVQAPGLERDMLRSVCFGLLQVKAVFAYAALLLYLISKTQLVGVFHVFY